MHQVNQYGLQNDRLDQFLELATNFAKSKDDENKVYALKIIQLEDIFKNLENLLMTMDKNFQDTDLGEDHDAIQAERQGHRD